MHGEKILFANSEAGELLGVPADSLVGRDVIDIIRPAYRSRTRKIIDEQLAGGRRTVRYELQLIDGEERTRWVEATGTRMRYRGRSVILTVARDITYRKSVEATLGRGRQQAQITLESLGEGIITADIDGNIDYMNVAAEGDCGWVTCVENITSVLQGRASNFGILATNIFVRTPQGWRMTAHHGSPQA